MASVLMLLDFIPNQQRAFETFLLRVSHELRAAEWQAIFVFAGEPSEAFGAELRAVEIEYRVCSFPMRRRDFEALTQSLAGYSPLVMTNTFISCFDPYLLKIKKQLRIRHWLVHDESSGIASSKAGVMHLLCRLRGAYYGWHIDRVLAVSEFVARRNVEQSCLPPSRIKVLRNAVDLNRFHPETESATRQGEPRIVFVGQLIPEKGVRTLLRAMVLLKQRPAPVTPTLEIAGRGALEEELRAYVADNGLDHVRFLGQVLDVAALYRAATVVVVPSEWAEAAAFVIAEAMACGACVLASDAGGNPDLLDREEEGGRLFRSGDAYDLAQKLLDLLGDSPARERYRKQARDRAERLFRLEDMVQGFVQELQDVASND